MVYATVILLIWPVVDLAKALGRRNDVQMARLQFVFAHTGPSDPVLDGWLGMGVFRPHPLYYFFMHRELQVSLTEREKRAYVDALTDGKVRPALIALDDELRALGPRFLQYVQHNYVSDDGVLYLPRQPASSPSAAQHGSGRFTGRHRRRRRRRLLAEIHAIPLGLIEGKHDPRTFEAGPVVRQVRLCVAMVLHRPLKVFSSRRNPAAASGSSMRSASARRIQTFVAPANAGT